MLPTQPTAQAPSTTWSRLFWRVAWSTGVQFGAWMVAFELIFFGGKLGSARTLTIGAGAGLFFGLSVAATLVPLARRTSGSANAEPVRQARTVELSCTADEAVQRSIDALSCLHGTSHPTIDAASRTVVKRTGRSAKSWGEVVTLQIKAIDDRSSRVHVESRPRMRTTLLDYGVNATNADSVAAALRA